ncbi:hypothetical protein GCM10011390_18550 [Aureimonas endophytica]|uniref:NADH:quinone oxidoreductase/Mrp antiporter transmembrane domain-containing protein n=1 Tax=Aureimonas endophytica TaxID=2027858 RepID=A0A916ZJ19_9HYPH|nr:complex I subunit 5 family protein [Aureimonas endophytica]GGE00037.1 hypothetical protein GCM10011390_18550 [Aureimonas endophytica]
MSLAESLLPLPVLLPLATGAVMLALAHILPPRLGDLVAFAAAVAVAALSFWLADEALEGPITHWFGGWTPDAAGRPGVVLGIGFRADPASAAMAGFCGMLFACAFVFAWGYFDAVRMHFHILMLLFLAAMAGFSLTRDLFNLFVWFELMSVAAFALTAYPLGESSLEGALNFIVTNTLASVMMLAGIGLLYSRTGTLDFSAMGAAGARLGDDPVLLGGFALLAAALLTKAAILPFHLWLADAHAVAPSPVSMIFSGAMVSLALFALLKLTAEVFAHEDRIVGLVRGGLAWLGLGTAILGALMAWAQTHLKRLLAFSTISHLGIMLVGVATLTPVGAGGVLLYVFGHGLVKAGLFMTAGMLLALRHSADEIALHGKSKALWPAGLAMGLGGLLLGGLPFGLLHGATHLIHVETRSPLLDVAVILSTALTGAAVLRAALRIFAGLSGAPGVEAFAPTERETEKANRPLWLMLLPCAFVLALALVPPALVEPFLGRAAPRLLAPDQAGEVLLPPAELSLAGIAPFVLMLALTGASLLRRRPVTPLARRLAKLERRPFQALQAVHSGMVGDYVAWMMLGLGLIAAALAYG